MVAGSVPSDAQLHGLNDDDLIIHQEFVVDRRGRLRQAGTVDPHVGFVDFWRRFCESNLLVFAYVVLGRDYLTRSLHLPVCNWLMRTPPYRKLLLLPRRHAKTSIVSHALPLHILVQPEDGIYMPGKMGCDMRILLAGETMPRATDNMRVMRNVLESNEIFRGFWPQLCWEKPSRDADKWNEIALVIPRNIDYPDPSIRAIGVGGAIVGARHDVHIKDDLVGEAAANSEVEMANVIRWHINSRALFDDPNRSLEFIIGTRWAVTDLYSYIMAEDPSVDFVVRSIIEDGATIYPEVFTLDDVARLEREFGVMFPLLYMNNIGHPDLVDFAESDLRFFRQDGGIVYYDDDPRDMQLEAQFGAPTPITISRGEILDYNKLARRQEWFQMRYGDDDGPQRYRGADHWERPYDADDWD